jgi:HEAT repeat protein
MDIRHFTAFLILLLAHTLAQAQTADPTYNGRKRSEWETMLREQQNVRLRKVAVVSLGQIASDHVSDPVLTKEIMTLIGRTLKTDAAPSVRAQAAAVCNTIAIQLLDGKSHDPAFVILDLTENLRVEKETEVRREVATALGRFGKLSKRSVAVLVPLLVDKDPGVREAGATALGRIGADAKETAPELVKLVQDAERPVKLAAVFALGRVDPEDRVKASAVLVPLLKERTDTAMRKEAVTSLGFIADLTPANVQGVAAALFDPEVEVRRATALALGRFVGGLKIIEAELKKVIVEDADKETRGIALRALCDGFGENAKDLLPFLVMRMAEEKDFDVKLALIEELGDLGADGKAAIPALREAQRDAQVKIREAAAMAIRRIEKPKPKEKPPETKPAETPAEKPKAGPMP